MADSADALVIVTEWDEFRALDLDKLASRMRGRALIDLRNVYHRKRLSGPGWSIAEWGARHGGRCRFAPQQNRQWRGACLDLLIFLRTIKTMLTGFGAR